MSKNLKKYIFLQQHYCLKRQQIKLFVLSVLFYLIFWPVLPAQTLPDTLKIKKIYVNHNRHQPLHSFNQFFVDSLQMVHYYNKNLAELLAAESTLFIKSYGQGQLASASFRGTSASHTATLWNGVDIRSPMLGQLDFSLIPNFFIDKIELTYGAGAVANSDGALGGAINLLNRPVWNNRLSLLVQVGFDTNRSAQFSTGFMYGTQKISVKTKLFSDNSANQYRFMNYTALPEFIDVRKNANYNTQALLQEIYWRSSHKNVSNLKIWVQQHQRNLPTSVFASGIAREEYMQNSNYRILLENKFYLNSQNRFSGGSAYIQDNLFYSKKILSEANQTISENQIHTFSNFIDFQYISSRKLNFFLKLNHRSVWVNTNNYATRIKQSHLNLITNLAYRPAKLLSLQSSFKVGQFDASVPYLTGNFALAYRFAKKVPLDFTASVAKNYHHPTLNDLYWQPGGNPRLQDERGFVADAGLKFYPQVGNTSLQFETKYYDSFIDNWIMWLPQNAQYWSPVNIRKVRNSGFELVYKQISQFSEKSHLNVNLNYTYTRAYNLEKISDWDVSNGKQLVYTPKHLLNFTMGLKQQASQIYVVFRSLSERYIRTDNLEGLEPYFIVDMEFKQWFVSQKFAVSLTVNNVTNTNYQSVKDYPMPLRFFKLALSYKWQHNKS